LSRDTIRDARKDDAKLLHGLTMRRLAGRHPFNLCQRPAPRRPKQA
jgi:hypothetical protein